MTNKKQVTPVKLKDGQDMNHFKDNNGRHVFFKNIVAMNYWTMAILIFILLTSILMSFFQVMYIQEVGNKILMELDTIKGAVGVSNLTTTNWGYYITGLEDP